jgi:hypothetical protein
MNATAFALMRLSVLYLAGKKECRAAEAYQEIQYIQVQIPRDRSKCRQKNIYSGQTANIYTNKRTFVQDKQQTYIQAKEHSFRTNSKQKRA